MKNKMEKRLENLTESVIGLNLIISKFQIIESVGILRDINRLRNSLPPENLKNIMKRFSCLVKKEDALMKLIKKDYPLNEPSRELEQYEKEYEDAMKTFNEEYSRLNKYVSAQGVLF